MIEVAETAEAVAELLLSVLLASGGSWPAGKSQGGEVHEFTNSRLYDSDPEGEGSFRATKAKALRAVSDGRAVTVTVRVEHRRYRYTYLPIYLHSCIRIYIDIQTYRHTDIPINTILTLLKRPKTRYLSANSLDPLRTRARPRSSIFRPLHSPDVLVRLGRLSFSGSPFLSRFPQAGGFG